MKRSPMSVGTRGRRPSIHMLLVTSRSGPSPVGAGAHSGKAPEASTEATLVNVTGRGCDLLHGFGARFERCSSHFKPDAVDELLRCFASRST
jgi:hypothetical protein